jgi:hypothetical protein
MTVMGPWSAEQVAAAAPDPGSLAAARKLAGPGPWHDTGASDVLVWGRCQGSGRTPYQVSVDLTGPAYRCTCPSRKFPCKHALALLLRWSAGDLGEGAPGVGDDPGDGGAADAARSWADERAARAARPAAREPAPADPEAAARRLAQRLQLMDDGAADLGRWLADVVRAGLAGAHDRGFPAWDDRAARLVDAQLPGLAELLRSLVEQARRSSDWPELVLDGVGRAWATTQAWQRREQLGAAELGDLRARVGWTVPRADVLAGERTAGTWTVLGVHRTDDGRLTEQRTWLQHEGSGERVLLLDFAAQGAALPLTGVTGARFTAEVARYPGSGVVRGLLAGDPAPLEPASALPPGGDLADAWDARAAVHAADPWTSRVPVVLTGARLLVGPAPTDPGADPEVLLVDPAGRRVTTSGPPEPWGLLARTGGGPVDVFAELEGSRLRLLSATLPDAPGVVAA